MNRIDLHSYLRTPSEIEIRPFLYHCFAAEWVYFITQQ